MKENVSDLVIAQRIRNGLIQYFELASSEQELLKYQREVPIAQVLNELVNQFEDWFQEEHIKDDWYKEPTYTQKEIDAILRFREIWEMLSELPDYVDSIGNFLTTKYWPPFQNEAQAVLNVLMERGYLSNETEEPNK